MEINFKPTIIQWKVWDYLFDNITTQVLFGGSARSSKSFLICAFSVIYCLAYPDIAGAICRSRLTHLRKTTLQTLFEFFNMNNMKEDKDYNFNRTDMIITFPNGSKLFFLELYDNPSDPDFDRIMSMGLTFACVDEVSEISENAINKLQTRLSHKLLEYSLKPKLLLASNPNRGWLYNQYYKPFKTNQLPEYRKVVLGLPTDNPYVSEDYIHNLESLDESTVQRLRYGNWDYDDDIFNLFNYDNVVQAFYNEMIDETGNYITCDVANVGDDKTIVGIWKGYHLINIYEYSNMTTDQIVGIIKEKMRNYHTPIYNVLVDADGIGIGVADYLKCKQFKGGSTALKKENYMNIRSQCYFKLAEKIVSGTIKFCEPYRERIIQELLQHKRKESDNKVGVISKDEIKRKLGRSPDIADMIMMRCYWDYQSPGKIYVY